MLQQHAQDLGFLQSLLSAKSLEGAGVCCLGLLPDPCVKAPRAAPAFRTRAAGDEASKATSSYGSWNFMFRVRLANFLIQTQNLSRMRLVQLSPWHSRWVQLHLELLGLNFSTG